MNTQHCTIRIKDNRARTSEDPVPNISICGIVPNHDREQIHLNDDPASVARESVRRLLGEQTQKSRWDFWTLPWTRQMVLGKNVPAQMPSVPTREREQGKTVLLLSMALTAQVSKKMSASKQILKANTLLQTVSR